ncbi:MAG: serine/threonine protein kinase, partial [Okeania sp. SIO3B3]|nr:serine/threonine protein kinase [Okeania sp. SIO3B3]
MTTILTGYQTTDLIYDGTRTLVYRGVKIEDSKPVILKKLRKEYPTFNELLQFRHQYLLNKNLDVPGIVRPLALEKYGLGYVLVMEDVGGMSLSQYISDRSLSIEEFLKFAVAISKILEDLYRNRVIHKDIKPANILINPETQEIYLIDFSISSLLPRETQEIQNSNVLEGTLAYISPEQTGRMNRGIDYRSDFYSLGVTFYQLLTGELPFKSEDPMELVHSHIAKKPTPVHVVKPEIPKAISDIVMKLMAKNAEQRYQSALGIEHDLSECKQQWQNTGQIKTFELGSRDISDRFLIPEKLYGRETEVQALLDAFERVANPPQTLLAKGEQSAPSL